MGATEMVQKSRALAFLEDQSFIPGTHTTTQLSVTSVPGALTPPSDSHRHQARNWCTDTQANAYTRLIKLKKKSLQKELMKISRLYLSLKTQKYDKGASEKAG